MGVISAKKQALNAVERVCRRLLRQNILQYESSLKVQLQSIFVVDAKGFAEIHILS